MAKLWADNIIKGKKTFAEVPTKLVDPVEEKLCEYVEIGKITAEQFSNLTGKEY